MDINALLKNAEQSGVFLYVEEGKLKYKSKQDALSDELKSHLKQYKSAIIEQLEAEKSTEISTKHFADEFPLNKRDDSGPAKLSYAQQRMWFSSQFLGPSDAYNIPLILRFEATLNIDALKQSLQYIVDRHEVLRTRFTFSEGEPVQIIEQKSIDLPIESLSAPEVQAVCHSETHYLFDLEKEGEALCRIRLLKNEANGEYTLSIIMHHSITDGWSLNIICEELISLYKDFNENGPASLTPLTIQYADYAHWQRQWLSGDVLDEQLTYWKEELADLPPLLKLPTDRPRPSKQSYEGSLCPIELPVALSDEVKAFSEKHRTTLFMTLMASFSLLLNRYSGQTDIAVGTPIANRNRKEVEGLVGFFVNTLVMRSRFDGDQSFVDLVKQVRDTALRNFQHQDIPFEQLVDEMGLERNLSHSPLFQVMFTLQNVFNESNGLDQIGATMLTDDGGTRRSGEAVSRFDLTLALQETDNGISGCFEYSTDLFDHDTVQSIAEDYIRLLEQLVNNPDQPVSLADFLSEQTKHQQLLDWNSTQKPFPRHKCIHHLFEEQAKKNPDAVALVYKEQQLTYSELNEYSNQLSHHLVSQGVAVGDPVGVSVSRNPNMIIGILAVLKAGGVYLPLDPTYPVSRLDLMVKDSGTSLILTESQVQSSVYKDLSSNNCHLLCLDGSWSRDSYPTTNMDLSVSADNLAYIIYTSGSTGKPKGVNLAHRGLVNLINSQIELLSVTPESRVVQFASLSFDAATWEWSLALSSGASLCLIESAYVDLTKTFNENNVTHALLPPAILSTVHPQDFTTLKTLVVGGESVTKQMADIWSQYFNLFNAYGPTEGTVIASIGKLNGGVNIGKPISNVQCYVMDKNMNLVPTGCVGELYIGGEGLAYGYRGRADITAASFVPNPYGKENGQRLYRTGDLVKYLSDGSIQFVDRLDNQVKIRGFRIEPAEIASSLRTHHEVEDAVVLVKETQASNKYLAAYIVPVSESNNELNFANLNEELLSYAKDKLPAYMVPSVFIPIPSLPLTKNGKLDVDALPEPSLLDNKSTHSKPTNEIEKTLCDIWQSILAADEIGIDDNFFASGGDSILSIQIVSKARVEGLELTVKQLFEYQTVRELAKAITTSNFTIEQDDCVGETTLLPIQQWFLNSQESGLEHFHQSQLLTVPEEFSAQFLRMFVNAIYLRHDALRLSYEKRGGEWRSVFNILDDSMVESSIYEDDLNGLSADMRKARLAKLGHEIKSGFDLKEGPLLKAAFFDSENPNERRLLLVLHHLVVDGVSWRVLLQDLSLAFNQWKDVGNITLLPKTSSFQSWGHALASYSSSDSFLKERGFWESQASLPSGELPLDRKPEKPDTYKSTQQLKVTLDEVRTTALLTQCSQAYQTKIQDLLVSSLFMTLNIWTNQTSVRIRLEGHGRELLFDNMDLSETVGWFTSVFPITLGSDQVDLQSDTDIGRTIKSIKEQLREVPNGGIGYGLLRYLSEGAELNELKKHKLPSVVFNYLGQFDQQLGDSDFGLAVEEHSSDIGSGYNRGYLLGFNGAVSEGKLQFNIDYNPECHDKETIEYVAELFSDSLVRVIEHCQKRTDTQYTPSDFPLVDKLEQSLLDEWQSSYPFLEAIYPMTGMQQGFIFHSMLDEGNKAYASQLYLDFNGDFNPEYFEKAWQTVINKNEIFRTSFIGLERNQPLQVVHSVLELEWEFEDIRSLDKSQQESFFEECRARDKSQGFDFEHGPLMRMSLFRLSDNSYRWLWTHHHSVLDGWSIPIVLEELFTCYMSLRLGSSSPLVKSAPYSNYISWLQQQDDESASQFWKSELTDLVLPTPLGIEQLDVNTGFTGPQEKALTLTKSCSESLVVLAKDSGVPLNSIIQAAWALLLSRYSGQEEVVFGQTVSGRPGEIQGIDRMVGLFINTIPVRASVSPEQSISDWLKSLHNRHIERESYGYWPLVEIRNVCHVEQNENLFNSLLVVQNYPVKESLKALGTDESEDLGFSIETAGNNVSTNYDLTLVVGQGEQISMHLEYLAESFSEQTIERLIGQLSIIFNAMADPKVKTLQQIPSQSTEDYRYQVSDWNQTHTDDLVHLPTEFEKQAELLPENVAVVFDETELSYKELNEKSNQLAHYLVAKGIKADSVVAIFMDSSISMIVSLLAVLKAGGAYLPLEPSHPDSRLEFMLNDSGASFILCDEERYENMDIADGRETLALDERGYNTLLAEYSSFNPNISVAEHNLAYLIYTSGSTGIPKGVMVSRRNLSNYLVHGAGYLIDSLSGSVVSSALAFDATVCSIYIPLLMGKKIELLTQE